MNIKRNEDGSVTVSYAHPRTGAAVCREFIAADGNVGIVYERKGSATFPVGRKLRRTTRPIVAPYNGLLDTVSRECAALCGVRA